MGCGFDSWTDSCPLGSDSNELCQSCDAKGDSSHIAIVIDFSSCVFSSLHDILTVKYHLTAYFLVGKIGFFFLVFIPCAKMSFLYSFLIPPSLAVVI